ncbi:MAG: prephenate dehydrogenase [Gemmataceae bacterium]
MNIGTLTIVGVGLIGGSIGLAVKRRGLVERVIGVGWRRETLDRALTLGAIDAGELDLAAGVAPADWVVFCTPVERIAGQIRAAAAVCRPGTLLTDAGSTKAAIVRAVEGQVPEGIIFIGSHPLAGSEKRGPEHADADLLLNRLVIVTPTATTPTDAVRRVTGFWQALGARVQTMTPESHDQALAMTSHLPHLAAAALAGVLPPEWHDLTATGFRDTTRVAAGDPTIWTGIFTHNRTAVLDALTRFQERLTEFQQALTTNDENTIDQLLTQGKKVRDALGS